MTPERLTRSASLTGYADLARSLGLDPVRLAADVGLPAVCLTTPDIRIPAAAVGRLLERSAQRGQAPDFGLRLAETRNLSNLGAVGLAAREQPTLRAALEILVRYIWAQNQALTLELEDLDGLTLVRERMAGPGAQAAQANELTVGVMVRTVRRLIGPDWRPQAVYFTHPRPDDVRPHLRVLGVTPQFAQDFNGLAIAAADLDRAVPDADPEARRRLQRYLELEAGAAGGGPAAVARDLIVALLPTGGGSVERVAALMGLSRRTLHRRLAEAGTTFERLLDEARAELSAAYAAAGRPWTEIAGLVGYSSLSALSRARRRWAGTG